MSALTGVTENSSIPEFKKIIDCFLEEVYRANSFNTGIRNISNNLKIKEEAKCVVENEQKQREPSCITDVLWDAVYRFKAINNANDKVLFDLRELI